MGERTDTEVVALMVALQVDRLAFLRVVVMGNQLADLLVSKKVGE